MLQQAIGENLSTTPPTTLRLVCNQSSLVFTQFFCGIGHSMAYVQMFRPEDQIRFNQRCVGFSVVQSQIRWQGSLIAD
jgi:hypothetical protein